MLGGDISHYQILEKLGEGGMGVVYKARDTHLDRFVAIKVLPPERVSDPERKRRFVQEAKSASALNHPNIITIYDISSDKDVDFIAMEYVAGKTLDQLIPRKGGALGARLGEALKIAVQIADALSRAHAAGIIHRDLKPGNVMVDEHGLVKVLDFGLAKLAEAPEKPEEAPTQTAEGAIVGTVGYMSPEQAEGKPVDARSDIFSFGSLLYEMVTGQRAFRGDSNISTLAAIIHKEPAPLPTAVPKDLEKLIRRCLRKDPSRRFQDMPDLKVALEELKEESDSGALAASVPPPRPRRRWLWAVGTLAACLLAALTYRLVRSAGQPAAAPQKAVPLTTYPGQEWSPSFSPDGNQVAFAWNGEKQDNFDIYVLMVGTGARLRLTQNPATDYSPAWSPDGRYIAFLRQLPQGVSGVLLVPPIGGPERRLAEIAASGARLRTPSHPHLAWSPDGHWLAASDGSPSVLISTETGDKRSLTLPPPQHSDQDPAFSPDGRTLAFIRAAGGSSSDLYTLQLSQDLKPAGEPKRLAGDQRTAAAPQWTPRGDEIIFSWGYTGSCGLWRVLATGAGKPQQIALPGVDLYHPAPSRQGGRLAYSQWYYDSDIWRIELDRPNGKAVRTSRLISSTRIENTPDFSPDGKRIAFQSYRSGSSEIWVCDADGSNPVQLTSFGGPFGAWPRWSPDGENLAFVNLGAGQPDVYVISARGGKPRRLTPDPSEHYAPSWSRDGQWIYYGSDRSGTAQLWKMPAGGGEPVQVTQQGGQAAFESLDGKFLYYAKQQGGTVGLWRLRLADGQESQILESLRSSLNFAVAENGIYFIPPHKPGADALVQFLEFSSGAVRTIATIEKWFGYGIAVSPDGRSILYDHFHNVDSDLALVENFR